MKRIYKKLRQSARGRACTVRIPGICNNNPETTVLAHLDGGGASLKQPDWQAAFACSDCHDVVDGRRQVSHMSKDTIDLWHRQGVEETQNYWFEEGLLKVVE